MLIAHFPPSKLSHRAWPPAPRPVSVPSGRVPESSNVAACGKDSQYRCLRSPIRKCLVRGDRGMTFLTAPGRNRRAAPRPARASPSPLQIARVGDVPTGPENPPPWQLGWFPPVNPPAGPGETGHVRKIWPARAVVYPSEAEPVLPLHTYSRRTRSKSTQGVKHPQDAQIGSHELHSRTNSRCVSIHYDEQAESRSRRAESLPKSRARPVAASSNAPVAGGVDASSACRLSSSVPRLSSCSGSSLA